MADDSSSFGPSKLGTKEHWDEVYEQELKNFETTGDVGEIWFGHTSVDRVVCWIEKHKELINNGSHILDIGCGNGILLNELAKCGYRQLMGVDYSQGAIDLAESIAKKEELKISFQIADILNPVEAGIKKESFDVCLDKGTFDAISLSTDAARNLKQYVNSVKEIMKTNAYLIITSCNWTAEELKTHFCSDFGYVSEIPAPKFSFGGQVGSTTTTLIFRKLQQ